MRTESGKTTLIHHQAGLMVSTSGAYITLGCDAWELGSEHLERIGVLYFPDVPQ